MNYLLFPPYSIAVWVLFLGICLGVVHLGKRLFNITNEEIANSKGSLLPMSFSIWGINIAIIYLSTVIIFIVYLTIPFFHWMISDCCLPANVDTTIPSIVGYICEVFIYLGLFSCCFFVVKKHIKNKTKRKKLFLVLIASSTIVWAALLLLIAYRYLLT